MVQLRSGHEGCMQEQEAAVAAVRRTFEATALDIYQKEHKDDATVPARLAVPTLRTKLRVKGLQKHERLTSCCKS